MLLSERIKRDGIEIRSEMIGDAGDGTPRHLWSVELCCKDGRSFTLPDPYIDLDEPTAFSVLDLLVMNCSVIDHCATREEWAGEFTTDPEQQERHFTENDFRTWRKINEGLIRMLGHQRHQDYLYDTDRSG